ncbi:hypothetical protein RJ639_024424 [Escallonia herrerae]|uniref:FBD domain-containing protein n=1 Tax=Escallonia herrerae TaxID=1293975 RepID=A0AA88UZU2_9ASTE|nr:hypothetical protein RJ639_024424 [Escallonia herrerae]
MSPVRTHRFPLGQGLVAFDFIMGYPLFAFTWIESQLVPACLLSKLRTLEVGYLHAHKEEDQLKLIKYFLKNAKVLEDMSISCPEDIDTTQIRMKLLEFPQGSSLLRFSTIADSD